VLGQWPCSSHPDNLHLLCEHGSDLSMFPLMGSKEGGKVNALTVARLVMNKHSQRSITETPFSLCDVSCLKSDGLKEANMAFPQVTQAPYRAVLYNSNKIKR